VPPTQIEDFDALARDVAHPDDFPTMLRRAKDGFATGRPFVNRFRRRTKDGTYRWIEARAQPLLDPNGAIVQWYIASIDIEDEMHAQEALRERERFLWQLVETLPALIDCAAPNGEPVYRSQQLREFLGYELEELDGAGKSRLNGTLDAGVHPDDVAGVKQQYAHCLSTGEPYARRHRLRRFDGEYRWVETRAAPMRNGEGAIVQWNVICLDIDGEVRAQEELRLAQERLARASQAASLAELSASIAHEVNQPLAAIVANSHACYRWLSAEPVNVARAKITTERVIRDANSAAEVVSRIRALFRQSVENRANLSVSDAISEASNLMAGEAIRRRTRIDIDVESRLPPVTVDRIQIQQVLINLIRNSMDAMDSVAGEKALEVRAHRVGNEVQTEISDFGDGIELPDRVFEPFFTTKETGMGMGLAICRSIVEAHGGRLWAEKNEPHGARFIFTLPIATKAAP
jgi:PAS domain S-box-containing protein